MRCSRGCCSGLPTRDWCVARRWASTRRRWRRMRRCGASVRRDTGEDDAAFLTPDARVTKDEGRADATWPTRPSTRLDLEERRDPERDSAGGRHGRHGIDDRDTDRGGRAGRDGAAGWTGHPGSGLRQGLPQQQDAVGPEGAGGSQAISRSRTGAAVAGRDRWRCATPCMPTGGGFAGSAAVGSCAVVGSCSSEPIAHVYETGGVRRVHLRGHPNIRKRLLVHVAGANLGLRRRRLTGIGTPRSLQARATAPLSRSVPTISRLVGASGTRSGAPYDIFVTDGLIRGASRASARDAVNVGTCTPVC